MALIQEFKDSGQSGGHIHGAVDCGWKIFDADGRRILQLDTYGSGERAIPGKVSQSIQLDKTAAKELMKLMKQAFSDI